MQYVIPAPAVPSLPVRNSQARFPVRRIHCVGRNFAEHAREMGASGREPPFFFSKPGDAVFAANGEGPLDFPWPGATSDLQHEVEMVVAICRGGSRIAAAQAPAHVWGLAVGIDLTRRDLQREMKERRWPWEVAKGFDASAPVGELARLAPGESLPAKGAIWLDVNGTRRQSGDLAEMIWSAGEVIEHLSRYFRLEPGDLVFTGTPAGVAALAPGDLVECGVEGLPPLRLRVGFPPA